MIASEKHLINLGINPRGIKQYLVLRERKRSYVVYLILENSDKKRIYRKVTDIRKDTLAGLASGNLESRDADSFRFLTTQLRTNLTESLRAVTEIEKCNSDHKESPDM